jgi:hypothetical protein
VNVRPPLFAFIKPQDILAIAVMAILSFGIDTTVGLVLQPVLVAHLGPLTGGLVSAIPNAVVIFLGVYLIPRIGGPTLYALIFLTLTTFTASFGPPGIYKIAIGLLLGLTFEVVVIVGRRGDIAYFVAVALAFGLSVDFTYLSWQVFGVASAHNSQVQLRPLLPMLTGVYALLGLLGSWIAYVIYQHRLARYRVIQQLRAGTP